MSAKPGKCVVCGGGPTVRSHLFPRALVKRIRGNDKNLVEADRIRSGVRLTQSGQWDDELLCATHENCFGPADDYAARFCRRIDKSHLPSGKAYTVANSRPDLLLKFACGTLWRHVASKHGKVHQLDLGPYRSRLEAYLFDGKSLHLETLLGRSNVLDARGNRVEVGIAPYKQKLKEWTVWHFAIGGLDFYVKTDQRPFPESWRPFLLNDNDPVVLHVIDPKALHEIPKFQPIFSQMMKAKVGIR